MFEAMSKHLVTLLLGKIFSQIQCQLLVLDINTNLMRKQIRVLKPDAHLLLVNVNLTLHLQQEDRSSSGIQCGFTSPGLWTTAP